MHFSGDKAGTLLWKSSYFWGIIIGDHAAECIGKSIRGNNSIQTIVIVNNGLLKKMMRNGSLLLERNSSLLEINLRLNYFGSDEIKWISDALKNNSALEEINLSDNNIGDEGADY
jgi:hypothetical protein